VVEQSSVLSNLTTIPIKWRRGRRG
jgi:hypothetical protein